MKRSKQLPLLLLARVAACLALFAVTAHGDPLRLLVIGNSFSKNSTRFLPDLARNGGWEITVGSAEIDGASLADHWNAVLTNNANPDDPKGKPYYGKSLRELLSNRWDVVSFQHMSMLSADPATFRPYSRNLRDFIKSMQPDAEVVMYQTWAYRADETVYAFTNQAANQCAQTQEQMWAGIRHAYHTVGDELGLRVIPGGDAFWISDSDPEWGYRRDKKFDYKNATPPGLPDQLHSLHNGFYWENNKLKADTHHLSLAGCYLGGLMWYGFLFNRSPEELTFVPAGLDPKFAAHLRKAAAQALNAASQQKPATSR